MESFIDSNISIEISEGHGIYIPQFFRDHFQQCNIQQYDWDALLEPEGEWYWDAWNQVLDTYECNGRSLFQNSDLFSYNTKAVNALSEEDQEKFWDMVSQ